MNVLLVGVGGMLGVALRYICTMLCAEVALWVVNVSGSFLLGFLNQKLLQRSNTQQWRLFLATGMLGSFTTFSSFSAAGFQLLQHNFLLGLLYGLSMTILCLGGVYLGDKLGRARR